MADIIPMSRAPGYGAQFAGQAAQFDSNAADRLKAQLEARSGVMKSILGNIENIAAVSGAGALDPLASAYAGQTAPIFGTEYSAMSDRLRHQMQQAKIGALNRSGRGGGGKGKGGSFKPGTWLIRNKESGNIEMFDPADMDGGMLNRLMNKQDPMFEVIQYGPTYTGEVQGGGGGIVDAGGGGSVGGDLQVRPDGGFTFNGQEFGPDGEPI